MLVVVVVCSVGGATTAAGTVCGWVVVFASGVERLAPVVVGRSDISMVLLVRVVGICSSVAEAPATACGGCACT